MNSNEAPKSNEYVAIIGIAALLSKLTKNDNVSAKKICFFSIIRFFWLFPSATSKEACEICFLTRSIFFIYFPVNILKFHIKIKIFYDKSNYFIC